MNEWTPLIEEMMKDNLCDISELPEDYHNFFDECDGSKYLKKGTIVLFINENSKTLNILKCNCMMYVFDNYYLFDDNSNENILSVYKADKIKYYYRLKDD